MQTAVSSFPCSGNVLDLNAYRRRGSNLNPPLFPEGPIEDDEPGPLWEDLEPDRGDFSEEDDGALLDLPFPGVRACRERPSIDALLDMAASAAMLVSALAAAAAVLL